MSSSGGIFRRSSVPQTANSREAQSDQQSAVATASTNVLEGSVGSGGKSRKECFVFEPQQWRKTVCKNCFRTEPEHKQSMGKDGAGIEGPTVVLRRSESAGHASHQMTHASTPIPESANQEFKSMKDNNNGRSSVVSAVNSAARAAARKMASGQRPDETRSPATPFPDTRRPTALSVNTVPTNTSSTTTASVPGAKVYSSTSSIDARYIEELENDFFCLEDKHETVIRERDQLVHELETKVRSAVDLQSTLEQYSDKVSLLERRCHHMDEEIKSYRDRLRLPESDQTPSPLAATPTNATDTRGGSPLGGSTLGEVACSGELQQRLNEVEQLCQEVMEENEQLKEEVEEMQREIEEMHDHFQEDDRDAMRELQRDLEAANKTCRILQFKLRKAERRYEQCEAERANFEERLARMEAEVYSEADVAHIHNLEEEVRVAKEVGVRLNNELDLLDEKRAFFEEENRQLKDELQTCHSRRIAAENEVGQLKLEIERVKVEKGLSDKGPLQVTDKNRSRTSGAKTSQAREIPVEEQQIQKELLTSRERETDVSEQLRFAEEEIRNLKRRVRESQVENDLLTKRLDRMFITQLPRVGSQGDNAKPYDQCETLAAVRKLSAGQLENEVVSMQRQMSLMEEENVSLRRKVLGYEKGMDAAHDEMQRLQCHLPRVGQADAQELDHLRNQLNLVQDHLARIERERDRQLRHSVESPGPLQTQSEGDMSRLNQENELLRARLKDWETKLRRLSREVNLTATVDRDQEWMEKYNDARETLKDFEVQLSRTKKRVSELQDENSTLRAQERKVEQRSKRDREKNNSSPHLSREVLVQEVKSLEGELDDVTADLTAAREQACNAQLRVTYLDNDTSELRIEMDRREHELMLFVIHVQNKNQVLSNLLDIMQDRNNSLQSDFDRFLGISTTGEDAAINAKNQISDATVTSTGSDDVFEDGSPQQKLASNIERQLRERLVILERTIQEERQRSEAAEQHLAQAMKESIANAGQLSHLMEARQLDLLKKELEEKDELLEAKDEQVADLRTRLEHSRKMNDALRALTEKEPYPEGQSGAHNVEIASYKKEIESARKEMQILRNNLSQADKIRERLVKDNQELQDELKVREDSIFEQDDEIEKRNADLRILRASMESIQKELEQSRRDLAVAKAREAAGSSGRLSAQIAQNEQIRAELNETTREFNELKVQYQESKRAHTLVEERYSQLSNDMQQMRGALQEKDGIIIDLNKTLQKAREQAGQSQLTSQTAETEKINLERQLTELKNSLTAKEQECTQLQTRLRETSVSARAKDRLNGPHDPGASDGTLSRRSAEVDRLRRELSMVQSDREDLLSEIKRLRMRLEKRLATEDQGKKDGVAQLIGVSSGNAYAKAIGTQQTSTKISLLNEHIGTLNRTNAQLKLQNESLHHHVIDYQRRYRCLKEQYEGEQEAWLTERVVLESKAKEQEERRLAVANTRKLLQDTSIKLSELELSSDQQYRQLQTSYEKLENEKNLLENKLKQVEEHQKLPKVLQRFGNTGTASRPGLLAAQTNTNNSESKELTRRLDQAERSMNRLRSELNELKSGNHTEQSISLQEAENARHSAEQEAEDLRDRMLSMECYRQQAELFRHRQFEVEEAAEKEYKLWQEEREHLISRAEEARVNAEQWCVQLQYRASSDDEKDEDPIAEVIKQMEKWCSSRGKVPCLKRRMYDSTYSYDVNGASMGMGSMPASPAFGSTRNPLANSSILSSGNLRSAAQRSTSMEWGGNSRSTLAGLSGTMGGGGCGGGIQPHMGSYRESSLGLTGGGGGNVQMGNLRGSAMSLAGMVNVGGGSNYSLLIANRCGRSVSPEVSLRKLSNYPDPTPGFMVRPASRQDSQDSLASIGDYTQRSFTLPGKPPMRSAVSPARKRFFDDQPPIPPNTTFNGTSSSNQQTKVINGSHPHTEPTSVDSKDGKGSADQRQKKKGSSQPPSESLGPSAVDSTDKSKSGSRSLVDRFAKWSNMGSRSSSKTSLNEAAEKVDSNTGTKKSKKSEEEKSKSKSRGKSPKSTESRAKGTLASPTVPADEADGKKDSEHTGDTEKTSTKPPDASTPSRPIRRSGSVTTISPAIMALRQKFAGNTKP